jgi:hypothetical protein
VEEEEEMKKDYEVDFDDDGNKRLRVPLHLMDGKTVLTSMTPEKQAAYGRGKATLQQQYKQPQTHPVQQTRWSGPAEYSGYIKGSKS